MPFPCPPPVSCLRRRPIGFSAGGCPIRELPRRRSAPTGNGRGSRRKNFRPGAASRNLTSPRWKAKSAQLGSESQRSWPLLSASTTEGSCRGTGTEIEEKSPPLAINRLIFWAATCRPPRFSVRAPSPTLSILKTHVRRANSRSDFPVSIQRHVQGREETDHLVDALARIGLIHQPVKLSRGCLHPANDLPFGDPA
jgi:hypothetical protein